MGIGERIHDLKVLAKVYRQQDPAERKQQLWQKKKDRKDNEKVQI